MKKNTKGFNRKLLCSIRKLTAGFFVFVCFDFFPCRIKALNIERCLWYVEVSDCVVIANLGSCLKV